MSNWHNQCSYKSYNIKTHVLYSYHNNSTQSVQFVVNVDKDHMSIQHSLQSPQDTLVALKSQSCLIFGASHFVLHSTESHLTNTDSRTLTDLEKKQIYFPVYSFPRSANTQRPPANEIHKQKKLTADSCF